MSNKIERYVTAATRDNTRRSYQSAVEHYEVKWGGFLPATANNIAQYLAEYAGTLTHSTLKQRVAALAQWHIEQGFPDPTKTPLVKKVLKGIRELHPAQVKQAKPLQLSELKAVVNWLEQQIKQSADPVLRLRCYRDRALILLGFWRAFRSDELCRLSVEHIDARAGQGMTLFLPRSKGDRNSLGKEYTAPALESLCPVTAYLEWIDAAKLKEGAVFRSINRWGQLSDKPLSTNSIIPLLRQLFKMSGIVDFEAFSSHSLRRGFASWATANQWELKSLMEYVGWKDAKSALRYIEQSHASKRSEGLVPPHI